jgi:hypothetical protein
MMHPTRSTPRSAFSCVLTIASAAVLACTGRSAAQCDPALVLTLVAPDASPNALLGDAVAMDGRIAVAGAAGASPGGGAAYVFADTGSTGSPAWSYQLKLVASDGVGGDFFGSAVAVSGLAVVVGAPGADIAGATDAGAAYV